MQVAHTSVAAVTAELANVLAKLISCRWASRPMGTVACLCVCVLGLLASEGLLVPATRKVLDRFGAIEMELRIMQCLLPIEVQKTSDCALGWSL